MYPSKQITLEIFGNTYSVTFPKTGQFIDIQTLRAKLTEGNLETFQFLQRDGLMAAIFVDTIATFNILIPQLREDLLVKGLLELELDKIVALAYVYKDNYLPWYEEWMDLISNPKKSSEEESKEKV